MAPTMHPSLAVHPGDWLKSEIVDPHGVSINRLAACFHVTRQTLSNLFNGHTALSADMAIRFEKAFGVKADMLMRMQTTYDMAQTRARADKIVVDRVFLQSELLKRADVMASARPSAPSNDSVKFLPHLNAPNGLRCVSPTPERSD